MEKVKKYKNGLSTRERFNGRFETRIHPHVNCHLLPTDWTLSSKQFKAAETLNTAFETAVNAGCDKETVRNHMTKVIATVVDINMGNELDSVNMVLVRLLQAAFEF